MQLRYSILPIFMYSHIHSLLPVEYYYNYMSICENIWTETLCDYLKYSHTPLERSEMPLKVQRSLKFESVRLTCVIMRHGARKKGASWRGGVQGRENDECCFRQTEASRVVWFGTCHPSREQPASCCSTSQHLQEPSQRI